MSELNIGNVKGPTTDSPFGDVSCIAEQAHSKERPTFVDDNALKRYLQNERLAKQMGVYFMQLCELRKAMGREHLTELLNDERKKRLDKIKEAQETRRDNRKARRGVY